MGNTIATKIIGGLNANFYTVFCAEVTIDTYATGGVSVPFGTFTPTALIGCECISGTNTYEPAFDFANKKIKLFKDDGTSGVPAEVSAGAITETKFHITCFGTLE